MSPMDGYAFLAVSVVPTGFLAGTVIFVFVFLSECGGKFLLKPQAFLSVASMKGFHRFFFFWISINDQREFLLSP